MEAGFYALDITPALGSERPGDYRKAYHTAFHDPLWARAGWYEDEAGAVGVITLDTLNVPRSVCAAIGARVAERTGLDPARLLVCASHTHSGGPLGLGEDDAYAAAPAELRALHADYSVVSDPAYVQRVIAAGADALAAAQARRETVRLASGLGHEDQVAYNRRFRMRDGTTVSHPQKGNPDILEPAGPTDPAVGVVGAWSKAGELLGCLVNYTCHATVGCGPGISADWVYYLTETIQAVHPRAVVLFTQGAAGDVTQVDNLHPRPSEFGEAWAQRVGGRVGGEVLKVLASAEPGLEQTVAAATRELRIARRRPAAASLEAARAAVERVRGGAPIDTAFIFGKERLLADYLCDAEPEVAVTLRGLRLGEAVLVANPAELFCALGLEIKAGSPAAQTMVVELAGGTVGYVPGAEPFGPGGGGYETVLTSYSNLVVEAGAQIVAGSLELAAELAPAPEPPLPTPRFTGPWDYGRRGPEID